MHASASTRPEWTLATRSSQAFASNQFDLSYKSKSYQILRHPEGGRKDVLRWNGRARPARGRAGNLPAGGEFEPVGGA
jgi:hypothetical protein